VASDVSLIFNLLAKDKASGTIGKVEKNVGRMGIAIVGMGVAAGAGLVAVGDTLDEVFDTIRVGTGATGPALDGLKTSFKNVAGTVSADLTETGSVLADFNTMTGATGEHLEGLTKTFLDLEKITGEDLQVENVTRLFGDWGVAAKDQVSTMDELFRVSQTTGIGIGDLTSKVVQFGAPLRNMGFTLDESVALFGKWQKEGVNTETVMAGLRKASGTWAKEGLDLPDMLGETIAAIQGAGSEAEAQAIAMENFGAKAGPDMAAAILEGRFEIDDLMATLDANEDTITGLADETDSWKENLAKLKNEGLVAIEPIASTVFGLLGEGVPILRNVGTWTQNNAGLVKNLAIALGGIAAVILAVNVGLKVYHGIQMAIRAATIVWTAVQWLLNVALTANPIGIIIVAIAALIAIVVLIATKTDWFQRLWGWAWGGIKAAALFVWNWIKNTLWPGIKSVWNGIVAGAKMVWRGIQVYFGFWKGLLTTVVGWVIGAKDRIVAGFNKVVSFVKGLPGRISSAARGLFDGIKNAFRSAVNWLISKWNNLSFTLGGGSVMGINIPSITLSTPNLPYLAAGGIVTRPTLAVLGESGAEAVVPLSRGRGAAGVGGPSVIHVHVDGSRAARLLAELLREALRTNPTLRAEVRAA
jgi:phage-related minor tail protein